LQPAQHAVVGDVAEQQVTPVAKPHRAFRPARAGVEPLDGGIALPVWGKTRMEDFNRRVGILGDLRQTPILGGSQGIHRQARPRCRRRGKKSSSLHGVPLLPRRPNADSMVAYASPSKAENRNSKVETRSICAPS